jgi:hypothetical protein
LLLGVEIRPGWRYCGETLGFDDLAIVVLLVAGSHYRLPVPLAEKLIVPKDLSRAEY